MLLVWHLIMNRQLLKSTCVQIQRHGYYISLNIQCIVLFCDSRKATTAVCSFTFLTCPHCQYSFTLRAQQFIHYYHCCTANSNKTLSTRNLLKCSIDDWKHWFLKLITYSLFFFVQIEKHRHCFFFFFFFQFNKTGRGSECSQAIMLVTDGAVDTYDAIFAKYNWPDRKVM